MTKLIEFPEKKWMHALVDKTEGDYYFKGRVIGILNKLEHVLTNEFKMTGEMRVVVQNNDGLCFIMHPKQLNVISTVPTYG